MTRISKNWKSKPQSVADGSRPFGEQDRPTGRWATEAASKLSLFATEATKP
jgi:hypothetical protein